MKTAFLIPLILLTASGCAQKEPLTVQEETLPPNAGIEGSIYADLSKGSSELFECSNGWTNGNMFNVTWRAENITFDNGRMQLKIDRDPSPKDGIPYSGAEYRSKDFYGYGRYEANLQAIKNDGVITSFFTYTGPSDHNPWDEIDVEILGKDTTKVQFNYFTNGVGKHEYVYDLGFDASEGLHEYAFEWYEDRIVWFVDGQEAYSADKDIPVTEGKIMVNTWCSTGVDHWTKKFDDQNLPLTAEYGYISYTPFTE
ncbi:MAG: glycoside hydrolase family 16 protein [Oscillospiraceae bacterium]|nr:glycoside hydrolase family 16 protein [Oscillospiraceae bacterium]